MSLSYDLGNEHLEGVFLFFVGFFFELCTCTSPGIGKLEVPDLQEISVPEQQADIVPSDHWGLDVMSTPWQHQEPGGWMNELVPASILISGHIHSRPSNPSNKEFEYFHGVLYAYKMVYRPVEESAESYEGKGKCGRNSSNQRESL